MGSPQPAKPNTIIAVYFSTGLTRLRQDKNRQNVVRLAVGQGIAAVHRFMAERAASARSGLGASHAVGVAQRAVAEMILRAVKAVE
jgi:hypothetical protein